MKGHEKFEFVTQLSQPVTASGCVQMDFILIYVYYSLWLVLFTNLTWNYYVK